MGDGSDRSEVFALAINDERRQSEAMPANGTPPDVAHHVPATSRSYLAYLRELYERRLLWFQRRKRKEPPFTLYVGKRGRGKSLQLTRDAQRELARGSLVLSNYPVYDPRTGRVAVVWFDIADMMNRVAVAVLDNVERVRQGLEPYRIILVMDEAQNHFDARDWEKTPRWFRQFLAESRHFWVGVLAATQSISQVDKRFRILCDEVVRVRPVIEGFHHRFALYRCTALAEDFDSADDDARELGFGWLSWVTARAYGGYSTAALPTEQDMSAADSSAIEKLIAMTREAVSD